MELSWFKWRFDQGKGILVRVSGEFELFEFELLNRVKMTGKWGETQGKLDLVRASREFELSEIELSGFYYITVRQSRVNSAKILNSSV